MANFRKFADVIINLDAVACISEVGLDVFEVRLMSGSTGGILSFHGRIGRELWECIRLKAHESSSSSSRHIGVDDEGPQD